MNFHKFFALLLILLVLNSTIGINFILKTLQNDKKLSNYICKVTKDIIKSKTDTQDVLIGNLGSKLWTSTLNDIVGCIGDGSAVVASNFENPVTGRTIRRAAVVILAFNEITEAKLPAIIERYIESSTFNHASPIICLVSSSSSLNQQTMIFDLLSYYSFLNCVIIFEEQNKIKILSINSFTGDIKATDKLKTGHEMFPDKLKNLFGFSYRVPICTQYPRIFIDNNGRIRAYLQLFMAAVVNIQNAHYDMILFRSCMDISTLWNRRSMELTFNTLITFPEDSDPKLLIYEENGYCGLVPLPLKTQKIHSIFIKPFDGLTWLFLMLTVVCCVAVWWMFRRSGAVDSPWLLAYGSFVMFVGQGVEFSRQNRLVLAILLQLIIVMIWILSQAYEGVITSIMIQPIQEHRLETFDDLVASDYNIASDQVFDYMIRQSEVYKSLKLRLNTSKSLLGDNFEVEVLRQHYVFMLQCDQAQYDMNLALGNGKKLSDYYYLLPQKIFPYPIRLEASYLNPFIERLQYYMDLSFQAGLPYIWKIFMSMTYFDQYQVHLASPSVIYLEDLGRVFGILLFGCLLSVIVLLIEICCHDILRKIKFANLPKMFGNQVHQIAYRKRKQPKNPKYQKGALYYILNRHKRIKRLKARKLKVRRIYVQPRFPMD